MESNDSGQTNNTNPKRPKASAWGVRAVQFGAAVLAVACAFGLTYLWPERSGLDIDIDTSARAQEVRTHAPYDLTRRVLLLGDFDPASHDREDGRRERLTSRWIPDSACVSTSSV